LRTYEYLYILEPQEENVKETIGKLKDDLNKMGAHLIKEEELGKRRLAYEIRKKTDGFYYITQIELAEYEKLADFENELKLNPNIMRFMRTRL
jgi:small subunit ribosomal protein S6